MKTLQLAILPILCAQNANYSEAKQQANILTTLKTHKVIELKVRSTYRIKRYEIWINGLLLTYNTNRAGILGQFRVWVKYFDLGVLKDKDFTPYSIN